jgi:hypothetical protein
MCCYCGERYCLGGLCDQCVDIAFPVEAPAPEPPRERFLDAEVFGVGRMEDGGAISYVREITSDERLAHFGPCRTLTTWKPRSGGTCACLRFTLQAGGVRSATPTTSRRSTTEHMSGAARKFLRT